ncbi:probable LIM domain-containing serine/threonine-protein kinase DDB_G0286997 [Bactrocera dorsalis]|uniref:Probable LIM domain-containing serine/threonine-protein kinase DDB_G0286997 n=1 Tax=Bactrocera dorsalis TaxID=27457 RepID=A0ABM3J1G3_BACDO|nr:probable LIM domain-containing serine/threonine-protein kinase DDB_G0286997 [Bactrocera dorsalis]
MRAFITLCLLASAYAKPQGYSYQNQQSSYQNQQSTYSSQNQQNGFQIKLPGISSTSSAQTPSFLQQALQNTKLTQSLISAPAPAPLPSVATPNNYYQPQFQSNFQASHLPVQQPAFATYPQQQYQQGGGSFGPAPSSLVTKDIYVHVAPEEQEERYQRPVLPPPPPRKHYRIVFIKAPSPKPSAAALRINQAPTEEKTIIYVLTRKPDPLDLEAAYQEAAPKQPSKPEVYFIKYRTQEEAQHAQRTIQEQYDQLGGTTQVSDEGIAPVTSVIGSLDPRGASAGGSISSSSASSSSSSSASSSASSSSSEGGSLGKYLPPITQL